MEKPLLAQEITCSCLHRSATGHNRSLEATMGNGIALFSSHHMLFIPTRHLGLSQCALLARLDSVGVCEELKGYLTRKEGKQSVLSSDDVSSNKARDAEKSGHFLQSGTGT